MKKQGTILVSLIIIVSVILTTVASYSVQSVLLGRGSLDQFQAKQAGIVADSLLYNAVQNYMRFGISMPNPYTDWTSSCLHEPDWMCKMVTGLTESGGTIEAWGQYGGKIKHLRVTILVDGNGRISVSNHEELF